MVGWRLLRCLGLFWSPPGLLLPVSGLFMVVGESVVIFLRGCLTRSFFRWHSLPSRSDEVDGLASPYTSLRLIATCWGGGTRPTHGVPPGLVATVPNRRRKLPGASLSAGGFVRFWYLFMKYHRINGFIPGGA
jgi:hypothetical protein